MSDENLSDDFKRLGENLTGVFKAAWNRPERKAVQEEIEAGLHEIGQTLDRAVNEFNDSETGQKVRTRVDEFRTRVESGDLETNVRAEVRSALHTVNAELERLVEKLRAGAGSEKES